MPITITFWFTGHGKSKKRSKMGSSDRGSIIDVMSITTVSGNSIEVVSGNIFSNLLVLSNGGALYIAVPLGPKDCSYTLDSQNQTDRAFWGGEAKSIISCQTAHEKHLTQLFYVHYIAPPRKRRKKVKRRAGVGIIDPQMKTLGITAHGAFASHLSFPMAVDGLILT